MNRRELFRRTIVSAAVLGTGLAREFPAGYDASQDLARADWKPQFFSEHQDATLVAVAEAIVPGAEGARVNRFIDTILAVEETVVQRRFVESLAYIDGEAFDRYGNAFVYLKPEQKNGVLSFLAYPHTLVTWQENSQQTWRGHEHFSNLKNWISRAYYSSEAGMKELGYTGVPHGQFTGCEEKAKT